MLPLKENEGTRAESDGRMRRRWLAWGAGTYLLLSVLSGVLAGLGFFTFGYAKGASYLKDDPLACINCHVMEDYYESWLKSSHQNVAVCNDCHLSHHPVGKWVTKADNGFFHALAFTLENYREPIQIKPRNRRVTQQACLYCHEETVAQMLSVHQDIDVAACVTCHADVGHAANRPRTTPTPWITRD